MGFVHLRVRIANFQDPTRAEELDMLADSGALYSVVPGALLQRLGVQPARVEEFEVADGRLIRRGVGTAEVSVQDRTTTCNVIFGEPDDSTLLGVVTLEELGLVINPSKGTLERIQFRLGSVRRASPAPGT